MKRGKWNGHAEGFRVVLPSLLCVAIVEVGEDDVEVLGLEIVLLKLFNELDILLVCLVLFNIVINVENFEGILEREMSAVVFSKGDFFKEGSFGAGIVWLWNNR